MSPSSYVDHGARSRVALLIALIAALVLRVGPSVYPHHDLRPAAQKYSARTHDSSGKPLLDDAELQLKAPAQTAVLPLPATSTFAAFDYEQVSPTFDGRGLHYDRPPPLA